MALNTNFYKTVNELVSRASTGTINDVVDYASFISAGVSISSLGDDDYAEFQNAFAKEFANKIRLTIDTSRDYIGSFSKLDRGSAPSNSIIEIVTHGFYKTRVAAFANLVDGQSVDMYEVNKGEQKVTYYAKDNPIQLDPITIQRVELEGAFLSPSAMESFLNSKIRYAINSFEYAKEQTRRGLIADLIVDVNGETEATAVDVMAEKYNLLQLYYDVTGIVLDKATALHNSEFIRFAVQQINKVKKLMKERSNAFNMTGTETFTPMNEQELFVHTALASGVETYNYQDARRPQSLGDYEEIAFWQNQAKPFVVEYGGTYDPETETWTEEQSVTDSVVAVLNDRYAIGEWVTHYAVNSTPYNASGEYTNIWINGQVKDVRNKDANAVIFTLGDVEE